MPCFNRTDYSELELLPCRTCDTGGEAYVQASAFDVSDIDTSSILTVCVSDTSEVINATGIENGLSVTIPSDMIWLLNVGTGVSECTLGMMINPSDGSCFGYNGSLPVWLPQCILATTLNDLSGPLYGVFQTLSTRNRGGPLRTVEWDDAACVCSTTACPAILTITGLDGHGLGALVAVSITSTTITSHG
jgi:hypothetical protein